MKPIEFMSDSTATIEFSTTGTVANANGNAAGKGNGSENLTIDYLSNSGNNDDESTSETPPPPPPPPQRPGTGNLPAPERANQTEAIKWPPKEQLNNLDMIKSPEFEMFGRNLVKEILRLEAMSYNQKYREQKGLIETLSGAEVGCYLDRLYVDLQKYVEYYIKTRNKPISPDEERLYLKRRKSSSASEVTIPTEKLPQTSVSVLLQRFRNAPQKAESQKDLLVYLKHAHDIGLLSNVEAALNEIYRDIASSRIPPDMTKQQFINNKLEHVDAVGVASYEGIHSKRPEVEVYKGIWEFYIELARNRLNNMFVDKRLAAELVVGEWDPFAVKKEEGNHWKRSESYPEYYNVTAVKKEEFIKAKDSFLQMIKAGNIGKGPDTIYSHIENFRKVFGGRAAEMADAKQITHDFAREIRQELEGLAYLWGADYANETYNSEQYKQFMTAFALHEGPQRWVRIARSGEGQVAAFAYKWDKDARLNLYHNPGGTRGQINNDTLTQNYLQDQIKQILVEEGVGIGIKDYDPIEGFDPESTIEERTAARQKNIERIGIPQSDDSFKALYNGFEKGDANINNYLYGRLELIGGRTASELTPTDFKTLLDHPKIDPRIKRSIQIGKVQYHLNQLRELAKQSLQKGDSVFDELGQSELDKLIATGQITKEDKEVYKEAFDKSTDSFDVAYQMVGVTGEKVRRGGGEFYIDKNPYIQSYLKLRYFKKEQLTDKQLAARKIGEVLWKIRNGKKIDELSKEEQDDYNKLSEEQRLDVIDHMPVYMAEKFVQFAENWVEMRYGDDSPIWKQPGFKERVRDIPNFRAEYRAAMKKEARIRAALQIQINGFQAILEWADFDASYLDGNGNKNPITAFSPMTIKVPIGQLGKDGRLDYEHAHTSEKEVTFEDTQKHWLSRWTSHTYFFYQQENRHMLLKEENFKQAQDIKDGKLREEDADPLAVFLLILDPTLKRLKQDRANQEREIEMVGAAVEESYQNHYRIDRNLHRLFLPRDGDVHHMRMGYNREDYGGASRFSIRCRDLIASQPRRFARRMGALIADIPMEMSSMPDIWGADGLMGAITMMAEPIGDIAGQKLVSQFALTKFNDQMSYAWNLFEAFVGHVDGREVVDKEGLAEKPTNNSDKLQSFRNKGFQTASFFEDENQLLYAFVESFGRLKRVLEIMRVMMSSTRNAQGLLWVEDQDIFLPDGMYNDKLAENRTVGTSRHSTKIFFDTYTKWLLSEAKGGGVEAYPDDAVIYSWLGRVLLADKYDEEKKKKKSQRTVAGWLFEKMAR